MGKMQRDKGARIEREIVSEFRKIGLWAEKSLCLGLPVVHSPVTS